MKIIAVTLLLIISFTAGILSMIGHYKLGGPIWLVLACAFSFKINDKSIIPAPYFNVVSDILMVVGIFMFFVK